jgi:hypothetical protein
MLGQTLRLADGRISCEDFIRDRSQVELIPNLFGSNRRPTGQRGAFLFFRDEDRQGRGPLTLDPPGKYADDRGVSC